MIVTDSQDNDPEDRLVEYPTILRRYLSSFIDGYFIVVSVILVPYVIGIESALKNSRTLVIKGS